MNEPTLTLVGNLTGDPIPTRRHVNNHPHEDLAEAVTVSRFWRSVQIGCTNECWPWMGDSDDGYGVFFYRGKVMRATELALSFTTGEKRLPGMDTCHACDNPSCVNPGHLRFGSRQSNVDDMHARGRAATGERHPGSKITADIVREIRLRRAMGALQKSLAAQYGISAAYISDIVNGLVWQDAGGPITGSSKRTKRTPTSRRGKVA